MATCPQCGAIHMPSARTCRKCGASLSPVERPTEPSAKPPTEECPPAVQIGALTITLVVIGAGERICLLPKLEYLIGRSDPESGIRVDVDTMNYGGWEAGVSRRHARIFKDRGQFFIEDLRSANGTFLNEARLEPGLAYPLHHGDLVKLGALRLYVELDASG